MIPSGTVSVSLQFDTGGKTADFFGGAMDNRKQRDDAEDFKQEIADISDSRSSFVPMHDFDLADAKRSGSYGTTDKSPCTKRRSTGPRTIEGKNRSKNNAAKHGIFSKVVLLPGESRVEFESLLKGLRDYLQPVGTLEIIFVDKLAALLWRQRRSLIAEGAEIRKGKEFIEWDWAQHQREDAAKIKPFIDGLMRKMTNHIALETCLDLLGELKEGVEENGFDPEYDKKILAKLYGDYPTMDWQPTLFNSYLLCAGAANFPEEERQQEGCASPQKCKDVFLRVLKEEIERLDCYKSEQTAVFTSRLEVESLRQNVPDTAQLDRLLRYETSLERSIDRTLSQLERLQRMRLGQPVLPKLEVRHSLS
jgi:hypothetical protein